jgi:hypothetical protein
MCHGMQRRAAAPLPEPEKAAAVLYGGLDGATGGVGSVDTDVKDVMAAPKQMVGMF